MIAPANVSTIASRIGLLTDILLGAASVDGQHSASARDYVRKLVIDLLSARALPAELDQRIDAFDPESFSLHACASDFLREPPMSARRLLELVAYVTLADGGQSVKQETYLRALGDALGLQPKDYADLCREKLHLRDSFVDLARVRLPS
jgi:hypothetical protein